MSRKIALITGITGQDGSHLAELLLDKGYHVHGIIRRSSSFNTGRIDHIYDNPYLDLHYGDLSDSLSLDMIIGKIKPDEIYHLGAQSHVHVSFKIPGYTAEVDGLGTLYLLESMRKHCPNARFYNAATSELYGKVQETPQSETTPFYPRSPYGVAKLYAYWIVKNYRESYNLFAASGILFNHEGERRGETFVTRKITIGLTKYIKNFFSEEKPTFYLGNLDAKRDWGYAKDYVEGMWLILQQDEPEDFVLATGETHTIKEFIDICLEELKFITEKRPYYCEFRWDKDEKGRDILMDRDHLVIGIDEQYYRPAEVELLLGDPTKAKNKLGWEPKTNLVDLVRVMIQNELT